MTTSLITGATSGLGAAFARRLAADGHRLVLVARDEERLARAAADLLTRYNTAAEVLPADLADDDGIASVEARLRDPDRPVHVLVNNAGFGNGGGFLDVPVAQELRMLKVHCEAVLRLTSAAVPAMRERRRGFVINVASVAAFMSRGTYGASKAWVVSFTEGVAQELAGSGVRFLALCPGFVRTEFHARAGMDASKVPSWAWLNANKVVATALRDLARDRTVSVPDPRYKLAVALTRHLPTSLYAAASTRTGRRYDPKF
ncbi:SDR family NAD(P)-dependent oxidoreductase [Actinacidiphila sp. ITFR-21]|uniref:SDR family NAD(P)-dependent oxidoreductase n=1 Tax=Actinacidiphila sp. ITFR-21 TaxID=3075199 RepID=UPI00288AFF1B|nr:SDR family NAD(P)-dependent oxidoreductase [Streptomyces sp. ITFR-21]WNI17322.1 SDR family NAD(P)-dependent oxidoreductase [Streptomyces sp. ITFR-21]